MTHDSGVAEQPCDVVLIEPGDPFDVESVKYLTEGAPLPEDGDPREAGLEPFEAQFLEQPAIVTNGSAPLIIVIGGVFGAPVAPTAPDHAVGTSLSSCHAPDATRRRIPELDRRHRPGRPGCAGGLHP